MTTPWKKNETKVPMLTATKLPVKAQTANEMTIGMAKLTICATPAFPLKNMKRVKFVKSSRGCKMNCKRWVIETPQPTETIAIKSISKRVGIGKSPMPCAAKNDETNPMMTLNVKTNSKLPITRGQSILFKRTQLRIAAISPYANKNTLIDRPVALAKLAADAVQGADPMLVATVKPLPTALKSNPAIK